MRRVALFSLMACLCVSSCAAARAGQSADVKRVAEWTAVLVAQSERADGGEENAFLRFSSLDPDLQFAALEKALPKMGSAGVLYEIYERILQYNDAAMPFEPGQVKRLADNLNPRLLDLLNLGMTSKALPIQEGTLRQLDREFGLKLTLKEYPEWYARNGKRPVSDVLRDSVADLVAQLKNEKEGMRTYLLDRLRAMPFTSASWLLNEPEAKGLVAMRMTARRRQAAMDAGLLDVLATILHSGAAISDPKDPATPPAGPVARRKTLAFLSAFQPEAAYLARIAPDVHREFSERIGKRDALQNVSPALLLACPGEDTLPLLNRWIETEYTRPTFSETLTALTQTHDFRVLPAVFAALRQSKTGGERDYETDANITNALMEWRELGQTYGAASDKWLAWWENRPAIIPAAVFAQPLPHFPSALETMRKRFADNPQRDSRAEQTFRRLGADAKVDFLRDHFKEVRSDAARIMLIYYALRSVSAADQDTPETLGINRRTLELFDLGMADAAPQNQTLTLNYVASLTGNSLKDAAEYAAWRPAQTGKSNAALLREGGAAVAKRLAEAHPGSINAPLGLALNLARYRPQFLESGSAAERAQAEKILLLRRKILNDAGVTLQIVGLLTASNNAGIQAASIAYLNLVRPDAADLTLAEPTVRKIVEAELAKKRGMNPELLAGVTLYDSPWTTEALTNCLQKRYDDNTAYTLLPIVAQKAAPRMIPTLISLLDTTEIGEWQYDQINRALSVIAKLPENESRDIHGWVQWWEKRKADYPADVRALPYPRIGKAAAHARTFSLPQEARAVRFRDRPKYGYWRIASGYLVMLPPAPQAAAYIPGGASADLPEEQRPGLLVVLTNSAADFDQQKKYWMNFDRAAMKGRYVVALLMPPDAKEAKTLWSLHAAGNADAAPTAQALAADALNDTLAAIPVSKTRRYVLGIGQGGMAALACLLSPALGLRGAVLDTAPFHSADLPPLTGAKGKRIALLRDQSNRAVPEFIQTVMNQTLTKAGAALRAANYDGKAAPVNAAPFDSLESAIVWLEIGR